MKRTVAVPLLVAALVVPASTQSLVPGPNGAGRYEMQPVEGGVARLDTLTGEVSLCRLEGTLLRCQPSEEDRARLEARIRELSGAGGGAPPAVASPAPRTSADADEDAELDRAIGRMKRLFRAFRDIAREFEGGEPSDPAAPAPDRT